MKSTAKLLINLTLGLTLGLTSTSCSSSREAPDTHPHPSAYADDAASGASVCAGGIECIAIWILVYGSIATVRYIQEGVSNLTKFSDSVPDAIGIKCHVQAANHEYVRPCGQFIVDIKEKKSGKTRNFTLAGYDNQINIVKGKNRISFTVIDCGLTQIADEVKTGDVIRLEFPPECRKEK